MEYSGKLPLVTLVIVAVNVIVFGLELVFGEPFVSLFEMDYARVAEGGYYRLFTALFLHSGAEHIISNMFLLYCLGDLVERRVGAVRFAVIYFVAGMVGNAISFGFEALSGFRYVSVGASGAVYGVMGALICMAVRRTEGFDIPGRRILLAVAYCIYSSFAMPNIDFAAHFGGLAAGFAAAAFMVRTTDTNGSEPNVSHIKEIEDV